MVTKHDSVSPVHYQLKIDIFYYLRPDPQSSRISVTSLNYTIGSVDYRRENCTQKKAYLLNVEYTQILIFHIIYSRYAYAVYKRSQKDQKLTALRADSLLEARPYSATATDSDSLLYSTKNHRSGMVSDKALPVGVTKWC